MLVWGEFSAYYVSLKHCLPRAKDTIHHHKHQISTPARHPFGNARPPHRKDNTHVSWCNNSLSRRKSGFAYGVGVVPLMN